MMLNSITLWSQLSATISGTDDVCLNSPYPSIQFSGFSGTEPYTFTYSVNGGSNQTITTITGNNILLPVSTDISGIYRYELISVEDISETVVVTGEAIVTIHEPPIVTFESNLLAQCLNSTSYELNVGLPAGGIYSGTGVTGNNFNANVAGTGTFIITYTYTDINGCTSSAENPISVYPNPDPPVITAPILENVCPSEVVNLNSIISSSTPEGGSLYFKITNNPLGSDVTDPNLTGAGNYYLFYQNAEGCFSTGTPVTVSITHCPPDVTPTIIANPNIMNGLTDFYVIINVTELNFVNTSGQITVNIPKDSRWILPDGFNQSLQIIGTTPVNNNVWNYSSDAIVHIFRTSVSIPAGSFLSFGFRVRFNPGNTTGVYTITSQIVAGSGGENTVDNNADSEKLDYFHE